MISHGQKCRPWRVLFTWFRYVTVFGLNGTGVPDFGKYPIYKIMFECWQRSRNIFANRLGLRPGSVRLQGRASLSLSRPLLWRIAFLGLTPAYFRARTPGVARRRRTQSLNSVNMVEMEKHRDCLLETARFYISSGLEISYLFLRAAISLLFGVASFDIFSSISRFRGRDRFLPNTSLGGSPSTSSALPRRGTGTVLQQQEKIAIFAQYTNTTNSRPILPRTFYSRG